MWRTARCKVSTEYSGAGYGAPSLETLAVVYLRPGTQCQAQQRGEEAKGGSAARSGAIAKGAVVKQTPLVIC